MDSSYMYKIYDCFNQSKLEDKSLRIGLPSRTASNFINNEVDFVVYDSEKRPRIIIDFRGAKSNYDLPLATYGQVRSIRSLYGYPCTILVSGSRVSPNLMKSLEGDGVKVIMADANDPQKTANDIVSSINNLVKGIDISEECYKPIETSTDKKHSRRSNSRLFLHFRGKSIKK